MQDKDGQCPTAQTDGGKKTKRQQRGKRRPVYSLSHSAIFVSLTSKCFSIIIRHFFFLTHFRIDVTIPSVALGMRLTGADLQNDGCERVSREEEAALRACQAVSR